MARLEDTLFMKNRTSEIITRWSQTLWDLLEGSDRVKIFSDPRGQWELKEWADYLDGRVYIAMKIARTRIGSTRDRGLLLTEAGGYFLTEDGKFNLSL